MNRGFHIRHGRESRGYNQKEFAKLLGISQPQLCRLERSNYVTNTVIKKCADILNYPTAYFDRPEFKRIPMPCGSWCLKIGE